MFSNPSSGLCLTCAVAPADRPLCVRLQSVNELLISDNWQSQQSCFLGLVTEVLKLEFAYLRRFGLVWRTLVFVFILQLCWKAEVVRYCPKYVCLRALITQQITRMWLESRHGWSENPVNVTTE